MRHQDQLTSASYGDGLPSATASWSYDAAGNRGDAATDKLNRAASLGGAAVTNDVLGNRITKGGTTYGWDCLNRLSGIVGKSANAYRADGMRTIHQTLNGAAPLKVTAYRYDGQMGIEDVDYDYAANAFTTTRYGLGARGVDLIERTDAQGHTITAFPIYDAHGNNVASLTRNGTGGFSIGDRRSYDAWGVVRAQQSGGDPKLRYCGALGHKADDESGLIYMRARYYEPASGRFVSEDPARYGHNWFSYCDDNPIDRSDSSGKWPSANDFTADKVLQLCEVWGGAFAGFTCGAAATGLSWIPQPWAIAGAYAAAAASVACFGFALGMSATRRELQYVMGLALTRYGVMIGVEMEAVRKSEWSEAGPAVQKAFERSLAIMAALIAIDAGFE